MKNPIAFVNLILKLIGVRLISQNGWMNFITTATERDRLTERIKGSEIDIAVVEFALASRKNPSIDGVLKYLTNIGKSKSAFRQDLIALLLNEFKTSGTFIEVGACDGVATSNSLLLEREYGWNGILIEPARAWRTKLVENRVSAIDFRAAWKTSNEILKFIEKTSPGRSGILKTSQDDTAVKEVYDVETITLEDLISEHPSITNIDFLSVDTEGSELEVLTGFPFHRFSPNFICVEHNFSEPKRANVRKYLEDNGYALFLEKYSLVDDWFCRS